jgi:SAM-dependent methyltransferase
LDQLLAFQDERRWNRFFSDRAKPCPFFVDWPDENLVDWFDSGRLAPGRVLELGCGHGRNAIFMASRGCAVDAIDFSAEALGWARENAHKADVRLNLQYGSIFDAVIDDGAYDLVYDSGCFHHIAPHRRKTYVDLVTRALKPGGHFGLVSFRPEGTEGFTDQQVYEHGHLGGGLGYTEERLRTLWDREPFTTQELRQMKKTNGHGERFGEDFLWVQLASKQHTA